MWSEAARTAVLPTPDVQTNDRGGYPIRRSLPKYPKLASALFANPRQRRSDAEGSQNSLATGTVSMTSSL